MTWEQLCKSSPSDILAWADDQPWSRAVSECPQDEGWHFEGNVWTHTKMVCAQLPLIEEWATLTHRKRIILLFTSVFHDCGKPLTSHVDPGSGRITSPKHAVKGAHLARSILRDLGCDVTTREEIVRLVRFHGRPAFLLEKLQPRQTRRRWIDLFADYDARIEIVYVEPPLPVILSRNARRDRPVPERVIRELCDKCEPPTITEAHGLTIVCEGKVCSERQNPTENGART
jgi:AAA domain/HD domain